MKNLLYLLTILLSSSLVQSQDLEKFDKSTPIALSGSLTAGASTFNSINRESNRSPFGCFLSANVNIAMFGFDVPISLMYRDNQTSLSNPFNRFTVAPTYKWISLRFGNASMNFHPYVLSGQIIKGVGAELTPGKWYLGGVVGRIENPLAQLDTLNGVAELVPYFDRKAEAIKLGYNGNKFKMLLTAFRAQDDMASLNPIELKDTQLNPEANFSLGLEFRVSPFKFMSIYAKPAASAHTANLNNLELFSSEELNEINDQYGSIIPINFSSRLQFAGDAGVEFRIGRFSLGSKYQRVDPYYKSLGTFYFNEDYENYLITLRGSLFKSKLIINSQFGVQQNNLNNLREVTNSRNVANVNLTIRPTKAFTTNMTYSNFQTDRAPGLSAVNDTLRITRTSQGYGITPRLVFGSKEKQSSLTISANYQQLEDFLNEVQTENTIDNYNLNANYDYRVKDNGLLLGIGFIGNRNIIGSNESERLGGRLRIGKAFAQKKLRLSLNSSYTLNTLNGESNGASLSNNISLVFKPTKKFSASIRLNNLNRIGTDTPYQELRSTLRLSYLLPTKKVSNEK